jgi:hypothetical protein
MSTGEYARLSPEKKAERYRRKQAWRQSMKVTSTVNWPSSWMGSRPRTADNKLAYTVSVRKTLRPEERADNSTREDEGNE